LKPRAQSGSQRRSATRALAKEPSTPDGLLIEGDTCWRLARAEQAAVLIDAASYFEALRASLLAAQHSVFILGWELHSRTRLEGARKPTDGAPVELGKFLRFLLKRRTALELKILLWNHPVLYSVHRELLPRWIFWPREPDRVEIVLDSHLPAGASHHEKLVIIDDEVAYCGGIDLTVRRWDIAAHHPTEPRRRDYAHKPYVPLHDVQIVVQGDAAAALGERARTRWQAAGGKPIEPPPRRGTTSAWPGHVKPDFTDTTVGIMRTVAALEERDKEIREIERATAAAIGSAERFIYIENQYITAKTACEALAARMRARRNLQVVIVTTRELGGWLEARTMGIGRHFFMKEFDDPSLADRIKFLAPLARCAGPTDEDSAKIVVDGTLSIHVHAKVLIVDDRFLRIGSSNLNNRSMGFDTECDVAIEAANKAELDSIASVRNRLIAEHWGSDEKSVRCAFAADSVFAALESLPRVPVFSTAHEARHPRLQPWHRAARAPAYRIVEPIEPIEPDAAASADLVAKLGDPERVVSTDELIEQATGIRNARPLKWGIALLAAAAIAALLVFGFSRLGLGLGDVASRIGVAIESLSGNPWRVPLVLLIFVAASVVSVPILALIGATVVTLGPVVGFITSAIGTMLAASATFGIGRLIGRKPLHRWLGKRLDALEQRVAKRGVIAIALIRKVPVAPFTLVNMLIGALGIRYRDFILGTALGMLPGIAAFAFVSQTAVDAWRDPTPQNLALIGGAIVVWLAVVFGIQWTLNRRSQR
jgi:phospholipase D1/2